MDFNKAKEVFDNYVSLYDEKNEKIKLKYRHTLKVVELMEELATNMGKTEEEIKLAKIIGLLHDIGRFEQVKQTNTFSDKKWDHAEKGCKYLFDEGHIRDFIEDNKYDKVIEVAVRYHNKLELPELNDRTEIFYAQLIRDADKIDIYRVLGTGKELFFDIGEVSEKIIKSFTEEKPISREDVKTKSDTILLTLAFIFDMNYQESFKLLEDTDNFYLYISNVDMEEKSELLWEKIKEHCYDKLKRGVTELC